MKGIKINRDQQKAYKQTAQNLGNSIPKEPSIWNRDIQLGPALSLKDRQNTFHLLAILLESGLGIMDCLEVITEQASKKSVKSLLESLQSHLKEGHSLSESIALEPKYFRPFEIHTLKMGEQTGQMPYVLNSLALFYEKRIKLKRKITQALSYPIAVIVIAVLVMTFMIAKVVPMFKDIFQRFNSELPPITTAILNISDFFQENWLGILIGILLFIGLILFLRKQTWVKKNASRFLLKIPIIGNVYHKLQLSRFAYTFALLLTSKVNLDRALELLESITTFYPIQHAVVDIRQEVVEGSTLFDALSKHKVFPSFFTQIIRVGEKTARLDQMLDKLAVTLEEESEAGINQLTQFLEPLLIIILGVMVAVILVAMYLPMFELSNAIG